ncbi:MAG TPA: hypothetical protein VF174_08980 [Micromonosporaceae bacterium]
MSQDHVTVACADSAVHSHDGGKTSCRLGRQFTTRFPLRWARPKIYTNLRARRYRFAVRLNRYPGCVIGAEFQVGARAFGLLWGAPGKPIEVLVEVVEP